MRMKMRSIVYEATRPPADRTEEEFFGLEATEDVFIPKCSNMTDTSGR